MSQVPLETLPTPLQPRVGPEAPAPARMMVARALLPMPPADLFAALAYLITNEPGELATAATKSLQDMPGNVVAGVVQGCNDPALLDFALRQFVDRDDLAEPLLLNTRTPDDSVEWAAKRVSGSLVELIGNNQERIVRHPRLVEAIYYNPEAPMRVVSRVFETAVRAGLDLHHIPGFKEIYTSIFGDQAGRKLEEAEREHVTEEIDEQVQAALIEALPEELDEEALGGVEDDDFMEAMRLASVEEEEEEAKGSTDAKDENTPLFALVKTMSVAQKVRLALVGNKGARTLLIKDSKAIVALAVLKSPQVTMKEVADFAKNKALSDRIIGAIARNQKWMKDKKIRESLIRHPKSPPGMVNRWVRMVGPRDLKELSKSRDVPSHVSKLARNLLSQRQTKGK